MIVVKTTMHEYKSDPQSGAGNCVCGQAERHRDHFHKFIKSMSSDICTCGLFEIAACHMNMVWVNDNEVISKSLVDVMALQNESKSEEKAQSMTKAKYDIVVVVNQEGEEETPYIYKGRTSETVNVVMDSMDKDAVFGMLDDDLRVTYFKPNEVSKLQINLVESWTR